MNTQALTDANTSHTAALAALAANQAEIDACNRVLADANKAMRHVKALTPALQFNLACAKDNIIKALQSK